MEYIDIDAQLAELHEEPRQRVAVRLGGVDHEVHPLGLLEQMRLGARFIKDAKDMTSDELRELADLLPKLLPTAREYLEGIQSSAVFRIILQATLDAMASQPSPGSAEGNGSTVPEASQSPVPSPSTPEPMDKTQGES